MSSGSVRCNGCGRENTKLEECLIDGHTWSFCPPCKTLAETNKPDPQQTGMHLEERRNAGDDRRAGDRRQKCDRRMIGSEQRREKRRG